MERLTERLENGVINVKYASQHETAIHRLAAIEDILGDEYDLDRLQELILANQSGRAIVSPVEIGQRVYCISFRDGRLNPKLVCGTVSKIVVSKNKRPMFYVHADYSDSASEKWGGASFLFGSYGVYVFPMKKMAEAALRREQE